MNSCCEDPENRTEPVPAEPGKPGQVTYCMVCGRKHLELIVSPVTLGVKGA